MFANRRQKCSLVFHHNGHSIPEVRQSEIILNIRIRPSHGTHMPLRQKERIKNVYC